MKAGAYAAEWKALQWFRLRLESWNHALTLIGVREQGRWSRLLFIML